MRWLSANEAVEADWPAPREHAYSDAPAEFACSWCDDRFFSPEWLDLHVRQAVTGHGPRPRKPSGSHGTRNMWNAGCSCEPCLDWRVRRLEYQREWKERKREAAK